MLIQENAVIVVPGGREGDPYYPDIRVDLGVILTNQHRQAEVASVTKMKAPELLKTFNESWRDLDKLIKQLVASEIVAEREVEKRKATMLLEEVEGILKSKTNVSSTKDTRDAVIILDPTYQRLQDRVDKIHAMSEFLKGKLKSFENAYTSVKKILGEDPTSMLYRHGNPNLSHGADTPRSEQIPGGQIPPRTPTPTPTPAPGRTGSRWGRTS